MATNATYQPGTYRAEGGDELHISQNGQIVLETASSAAAASGLFIGGGTNANPLTTSVVDAKFIELRAESQAVSGDNRLQYLRYALEGGGGGECLRALTRVGSNVGTAHGAHLSLAFDAVAGGAECSGLGVACRGTLHIPDIAAWAPTGTYAAGMFEIFSDGTASDPAGMTELSCLRLVNSGGSGKADVDTDAHILSLQGWTAASGVTNAVTTTILNELSAVSALGFRIKVGDVLYYVPIVPAANWN